MSERNLSVLFCDVCKSRCDFEVAWLTSVGCRLCTRPLTAIGHNVGSHVNVLSIFSSLRSSAPTIGVVIRASRWLISVVYRRSAFAVANRFLSRRVFAPCDRDTYAESLPPSLFAFVCRIDYTTFLFNISKALVELDDDVCYT